MRDTKRKRRKPKKRPRKPPDLMHASREFWRTKGVEELAKQQGVKLPQNLDEMMGMGRDLWKSDEEFDQFLEDIRRRRHGLDSASREDLIKELAMRDAKRQTARSSKGSRRRKSVDELAKEQGFKPLQKLEDVLGKGKHLWKSDKEFKEFLAGIYEQRRKDCDS